MSADWEIGPPTKFVQGHEPRVRRPSLPGQGPRVVKQEENRFGISATIGRFEFIHPGSRERKDGKMKEGSPDRFGL